MAVTTTQKPTVSPSAPQSSFGLARRSRSRLCLVVSVFLALYIVVAINGIAFRHPGRIDLTEEKELSLSQETLAHLSLVNEEIRVLLPIYVEEGNERLEFDGRVLRRAATLLRIYSLEQPLIQPVQVVYVQRESSRWQALSSEFDLASTQLNRILFFAGRGGAFRETLMPKDLADMRPDPNDPLARPIMNAYRGEKAITLALSRLVHRNRQKAYFSRGHGELSPGSSSRMGYMVHDLKGAGFDVEGLSFSRVRRVPDDCDILIISRPEQPFTEDELDVVQDYLDRGGRMFVTLGARRTNLEGLLSVWGINVLAGKVRAKASGLSSRVDTSWVPAQTYNRIHPITTPFLASSTYEVSFFEPRPLKAGGAGRRLESVGLLSTGASTEKNKFYVEGGLGAGKVGGDDSAADYVMAIATQQEKLERPPEDWVELKTRLVVLGSSNVVGDEQPFGFRSGSHREFLMNCVNWLTDRDELIVAKGVGEIPRRINMRDESLRSLLFYSSVLIFPGIFLCLGAFVYFLRRT